MGASDALETFFIYGQAHTGSTEVSRILVKFPTNDISADRTAGNIPSKDSVDFYLRLYNAEHALPLPKDFTLSVRPITSNWQEGHGLDMESYKDLTHEKYEGANWVHALSASAGLTAWTTEGGDYETDNHAKSQTVSFEKGTEDIELDVTSLVEEWIAGTRSNYGVGIHMTGSYELAGKTYYTKKFFARGSQYFFKRPVIEARWDSSKKDDRGSFYLSSSNAPELDNVNTLYFYNYIRGQLKNIPSIGDSNIYVTMHTGSASPESDAVNLKDYIPSAGTSNAFHTFATGGWVETGIYTASVVITGALTSSNDFYYDVWSSGQSEDNTPKVTFFTGSGIVPKTFDQANFNPNSKYVSTITNLRSSYRNEETARFRLSVREKDWSPNIYTVASNEVENLTIEDAYYTIYRASDNMKVVAYGTGSATNAAPQATGSAQSYTRTSFDVSGNYFDLDMSLLQPDYTYGFKFVYYDNGYYHEQPETFKFRVEK
tara:strand:- start:1168 stop:2628 length:1461 start_codon:yes stop_codon:yes gene_type:complete